uniref:Uncharacterized protein n=1 Tax=Loa loa TaxID=7209 RepID=A0A1I7VNF9_LOALO
MIEASCIRFTQLRRPVKLSYGESFTVCAGAITKQYCKELFPTYGFLIIALRYIYWWSHLLGNCVATKIRCIIIIKGSKIRQTRDLSDTLPKNNLRRKKETKKQEKLSFQEGSERRLISNLPLLLARSAFICPHCRYPLLSGFITTSALQFERKEATLFV